MSKVHATLSEVEFTLDWYRAFLERVREAGHRFHTFEEADGKNGVLLRHDVDLSVTNALDMARVESELGIQSTYLFLLMSPLYNPFESNNRTQIRQIAELGHDVGVHFNTHQYWPKDDPPAPSVFIDRVLDEQFVMDVMLDLEISNTTSFHIPPEWVLDRRYDAIRSTYEPALYTDIGYVSDSLQRWRDEPPSIDDLPNRCQILTHPGLWGENDATFERRIEQAVDASVTRTRREASNEFLDRVYS